VALGATIYAFKIELADSDRGVYLPLELRVARHPSETEDHLLTRVLAYCLEYTEGIHLSNGLSEPDEPAISIRDLTGLLKSWIDVGAPDAARLHRAAKLAPRVARRMEFAFTVADRHAYLSLGGETLTSVIQSLTIGADQLKGT
jgi:uncharacterized protein YaeQ